MAEIDTPFITPHTQPTATAVTMPTATAAPSLYDCEAMAIIWRQAIMLARLPTLTIERSIPPDIIASIIAKAYMPNSGTCTHMERMVATLKNVSGESMDMTAKNRTNMPPSTSTLFVSSLPSLSLTLIFIYTFNLPAAGADVCPASAQRQLFFRRLAGLVRMQAVVYLVDPALLNLVLQRDGRSVDEHGDAEHERFPV